MPETINAIDLIESDHRAVEQLFAKLESATGEEERHRLGEQIISRPAARASRATAGAR
ncbi:MAG: hypothetical protein ACYDAD_15380 [Acidimicrobiales bacterium]